MKRCYSPFKIWVSLLSFIFVAGAAQAQGVIHKQSQSHYVPNRVIVKFKSSGVNAVEVDAADIINQQRGFQARLNSRSDSLDRLCEKYNVRRARGLFMDRHGLTTTEARQELRLKFAERFRQRKEAKISRTGVSNMVSMDEALNKMPDLANIYVLDCTGDCDVQDMLEEFKNDPHVEYVQPDYMITAQFTPDDHFYNTPFNAGSWGQNYADLWPLKADKMDMEPAWDLSFGAGVTVAVVDTGVDFTHPDLAANIYLNTGEISANGIDDDGNGFIDDTRGWNFLDNTNSPQDDHGHGTHVAGIIAAVGNNGIGVIGVAPQATIMPLRALDISGNGMSSDLADAIFYAADNGADIINNSWGCDMPCPSNPVIEAAVLYAAGLDMLQVFSAGNDTADVRLYSPQNMDETITVSASTNTDSLAGFSNTGPSIVLAAPGAGDEIPTPPHSPTLNVLSTVSNIADFNFVLGGALFVGGASYLRQGGTSMAAPHVSGLAALLTDFRSTLTPDEVLLAMAISADDLGDPGNDGQFGFGRLNAPAALTVPPSVVITVNGFTVDDTVGGNGDGSMNPGESIDLSVIFSNEWISATNVDVTLTSADSNITIDTGNLTLGNLATEGTLTVDFTFTIDPATLLDHAISDFTFQFTHDSGVWDYNLGLLGYVTIPTESIAQSFTDKSNPAVSADRIVWQDARNGNNDIYLFDAISGVETQITSNGAEQTDPKISGDFIVWQDFRNGNWDIFMYDIVLSSEIPVTTAVGDQQLPAIDGNRIVWEDTRNGNSDIYSYDIALVQETPITNDSAFQFNPDIEGDLLVWDENNQIIVYDFLVGTPTPITADADLNTDPAVSGDVVVWEISSPVDSIRMHDISKALTQTIASTSDLHYHPDISGDYVVWQDGRNGKRDIYLAQLPTRLEGQVTNQGGTLFQSDHPAIDGLRMAWDSQELLTGESRIQTAMVPDNVQIILGDVNGDGNVSSIDASQAARFSVNLITLSPEQIAAADVNGSGNISSIDASLIARFAVNLITEFPIQ